MSARDEAFVEFATVASARLLHAAYLLTGDRHAAEDATQSALLRTYVAWSRIHGDALAYAMRILTNLVIDSWRRPYREHAVEAVPEPPTGRDVAADVARRAWLVQALAALAPRERAVVVLRHYVDMSEADVALELNISIGSVKSLCSRALRKLRVADSVDSPAAYHGDVP